MPKYRVKRAVKPGKALTTVQKTSSFFAEEPKVGVKVLRRGLPYIELTEEQMKSNELCLKKLLISESVEIDVIDGKDKVLGCITSKNMKDISEPIESIKEELSPVVNEESPPVVDEKPPAEIPEETSEEVTEEVEEPTEVEERPEEELEERPEEEVTEKVRGRPKKNKR